jgi:hypothetical protein
MASETLWLLWRREKSLAPAKYYSFTWLSSLQPGIFRDYKENTIRGV